MVLRALNNKKANCARHTVKLDTGKITTANYAPFGSFFDALTVFDVNGANKAGAPYKAGL